MSWHDWVWIVGLAVTPLTAGLGAWTAVSMKIATMQATLEAYEGRLRELASDVRYAHQRVDELLRRPIG